MAYVCRAARSVALIVCGLLLATPCAAQTLPPVEAFGQLPAISQPQLSSDGKFLAAVRSYNGRPVAWIYELGAPPGTKPAIIPYTDGFIVGVAWANKDRLLITIEMTAKGKYDVKKNAWYRTIAIDPNGQNPALMFAGSKALEVNYSASDFDGFNVDDPDSVYMSLWSEDITNDYRNSLYRVDVNDGHVEELARGGDDPVTWIMDGHGHLVARVDHHTQPNIDHLLLYQNEDWKEVATYDASGGHGAGIFGITTDGGALVRAVESDEMDATVLLQLSIADQKPSALFFVKKYDVDDALADPWTGRIIGAAFIDDQVEYRYFDPDMQALQYELEGAFPGTSIHAVSWDRARNYLVVRVDGHRQPPVYYLMARAIHKFSMIAITYPDLGDADFGEVKPYPYKARDGLDIPAYLTLPPGKSPKNLPVVIMPHGGPWARDRMDFQWDAQFLANRGYAVLQPNFRGSSGYGRKFERAGYGEWGLTMQDDITDGVHKLIVDGIADPKRICIFGESYGGYAALAGAAFTPDLYACAASWAGISDLSVHLADIGARNDSAEMSALDRYVGSRFQDASKLDAASPAEHADRVKCPVLLMHGALDTTVRINQSEIMQSALERAGKHVEFVKFDKETHYMETADTRIRVLKELEKFLKENIGN